MKLSPLAFVLAVGLVLAPNASAYPAAVHSGHYTGEADDYNGHKKSVAFDVDYQRKEVKNFRFGDHHFGTAAMTIRHVSGIGDQWLFAETAHGSTASYRWNGGWNGPSSADGQVTETNTATGARHVFQYRAHKK